MIYCKCLNIISSSCNGEISKETINEASTALTELPATDMLPTKPFSK